MSQFGLGPYFSQIDVGARALRGIGFTGCGKTPHTFCHSERSEESLLLFMGLNLGEILRSAQNDKILSFSAACSACTGFAQSHKTAQAEAYAT